jgi:hypothetical protein
MKALWIVSFSVLSTLLAPSSATAGESLFGRVYTTETMPAGHFELEQQVRNRRDRAFGDYSAFDLRSEIEYGITDKLQMAFYVNTGAVNAKGAPDDDDPNGATGFTRNCLYLQGFSLEFIYRALSPYTDPFGLAFYIEPEIYLYDFHDGLQYSGTTSTEYRILLQKNFFDDQLILAYNLIAEIEFIRFAGQDTWRGELDWNNELGATYRVFSNFFAGLEFRNHNEYGDFSRHEHSVFWAGPTFHYGAQNFWATLSIFRQFAGIPNGIDTSTGALIGNGLFLRSHELWEITAKVGFPF